MKKSKVVKEKGLAVKENTQLVEQIKITAEDITKYLCPTATPKEVYMALNIIKSSGLNPFKREVYIVKYSDNPCQILTGFEVYLKRADRSGKSGGFKVWTEGTIPDMKACIEVYRKDWLKPLYHEVEYTEYCQYKNEYVDKKLVGKTPNKFWKEKPKTMLKKVVISQAFRLAYPDELGGLPYTQEEMPMIILEQNGHETPPIQTTKPAAVKIPDAVIVPEKKSEVKPTNPASEALFGGEKPKPQTDAEKVAGIIAAIKKESKGKKLKVGEFDKILADCGLTGYDYENFPQINDLTVLENIFEKVVKYKLRGK